MTESGHNSASKFKIFMADAANPLVGKTGLTTFVVYLAKSDAAEAAVTPAIQERGRGWYEVTPTTDMRDTLGDNAWTFTAVGAVDYPLRESVYKLTRDDFYTQIEAVTASPLFAYWAKTKVIETDQVYPLVDDPDFLRFIGYGYATVNLNSKAVDGFDFSSLRILGDGTVATAEPRFYDCVMLGGSTIGPMWAYRTSFTALVSLRSALGRLYHLTDCFASTDPPVFDFSGCADETRLLAHRWSGPITISGMKEYSVFLRDYATIEMITGDVVTLVAMSGGEVVINSAGGGGVVISATCTGGTVTITGNPGVITDNSGGAVTIVQTSAIINSLGGAQPTDEVALAILLHDWTTITDPVPPRSMLNALRHIRNRWELLGKDKTVFTEDDTTVAYTTQVTIDNIGNITADTPDP